MTANQNLRGVSEKIWIYTNYDCNLHCSYCLAESGPRSQRQALSLAEVQQITDEAAALGFETLHFTGGEPLLHKQIFAMLAYATGKLPVVLLTNAMLLHGKRLEALKALSRQRLTLQISLDGGSPEPHDAYRGAGSWQKTLNGLQAAQQAGFRVKLATTETLANHDRLAEICHLHHSLGIPEADHFVRPLAKRGFSHCGLEVNKETLEPELTVAADGLYWHPISTDLDLQINPTRVSLAEGIAGIRQELIGFENRRPAAAKTFQ